MSKKVLTGEAVDAPKVLILKGDSYKAVGAIFAARGYDVLYDTNLIPTVDLVVFTGGSDVSPYIYGEEPDGAIGCDPIRDEFERDIYNSCQDHFIPCVGICRGGQLLNVLNGGEMVQDHGLISGDVAALGYGDDRYLELRVDHHQGMYAGNNCWISAIFDPNTRDPTMYAGYYPETKSLCFQPHPEWGHKGTEDYFFELIDEYINKEEVKDVA